MNIGRFRQPAISALAITLISGAGIAFAANSPSPASVTAAPTTAVAVDPTLSSVAPKIDPAAAPAAAEPATPAEPTGPDTDTVQEGDQTTPDTGADAADAPGAETEKSGPEEPGDANLPGGGHADDPNDANADHQFEGVE
jgi:hypothetical protein